MTTPTAKTLVLLVRELEAVGLVVPIPTPSVLPSILTPGTLNLVILSAPRVISLLISALLGSAF